MKKPRVKTIPSSAQFKKRNKVLTMAPPAFKRIPRLAKRTTQQIKQIYQALDYEGLGPIYCDEGGDAFWEATKAGTRFGKIAEGHARNWGSRLQKPSVAVYNPWDGVYM
jgi:hypothetical protein